VGDTRCNGISDRNFFTLWLQEARKTRVSLVAAKISAVNGDYSLACPKTNK
jgi:hypothetical protein